MNTAEFFKHLLGRWRIRRFIPGHAKMKGDACFRQSQTQAHALDYNEQGQLTLAHSEQTLNCYKKYVYRYHNQQDILSVYFVEEKNTSRLFHTLQFSRHHGILMAQAEHLCKNDLYRVVYQSIDDNNFEVIYDVIGPYKNYKSYTFFQRI